VCVHCVVRIQSLTLICIDLRVQECCWHATVASNPTANWTTHSGVSACWLLSAPVLQLAECNSIRYKGIYGYVAVCSSPCLYHWPLRGRKAVILQWCSSNRGVHTGDNVQGTASVFWRTEEFLTGCDCKVTVSTLSLTTSRPSATTTSLSEVLPSSLRQLPWCQNSGRGVSGLAVQRLEVLRYRARLLRDRCGPCRLCCVHVTACTWCELSVAQNVTTPTDNSFRASFTWTTLCRSWLIWIIFKDPVRTAQ
jgi:hypothetical protein